MILITMNTHKSKAFIPTVFFSSCISLLSVLPSCLYLKQNSNNNNNNKKKKPLFLFSIILVGCKLPLSVKIFYY